MRWLDSVIEATNMNMTQLREAVEDRRAWRALVHGVTKSRTQLNDNDELKPLQIYTSIVFRGSYDLLYMDK